MVIPELRMQFYFRMEDWGFFTESHLIRCRIPAKNHKYSELDIKTGESVRTSYIGNILIQFINPCLSDDGANVISWCDVPIQYGKSSSMYIFSTHESRDFLLYNYGHYAPIPLCPEKAAQGLPPIWFQRDCIIMSGGRNQS